MRITQIRIDRFGVWSGLEVDRLTAPIVVFYGENEAGKTTLMQFVRTVLYGFSPSRRERYVPPRSARPGGSMTIDVAGPSIALMVHQPPRCAQRRRIARRGRRRRAATSAAQSGPAARWRRRIASTTTPRSLACGEIQRAWPRSATSAAADLLYELTLGIDRVSLSDVVHHLQKSRDAPVRVRWRDGEHPGRLLELAQKRDQIRGDIAALGGSTAEYLATVKRHDDLNHQAESLEAEEAEHDRRLRVLAAAAQLEPRWNHRHELDRRRKALNPVPQLPDDAVARLAELKTRRDTRRRRLERVTDRRRELMAEIERLKINEALCRQSSRLEALAEQQHWIAALDAQAKQLQAELDAAHPKHAADHGHATGHGHAAPTHGHAHGHTAAGHAHAKHPAPAPALSDAPVLPAKPLSPQMAEQLRSHAKIVSRAHKQYHKSRGALAAKKESAGHVHKKLKADLGDHADGSLTDALEKAGDLVSQLRRRVQIEERLDSLGRNQADLEAQVEESGDQPPLSVSHVFGLGLIFALGFAMAVGTFFLPSGTKGANHPMMVIIGLGLMGASSAVKILLGRFAGGQAADCQSQLGADRTGNRIGSRGAATSSTRSCRGGGPLTVRLQAAEKELARLEDLVPLDAERQSHGQTLRSVRQQHKTTKAEFQKARERWQQLLRQAGFPAELTPKQLRAALEHGQRLDTERRHLDDRQRQLADCRRQHDLLSGRILDLAADARLDVDETDPLPLLKEMLRRLEDERLRMNTRDQSRGHLTKVRRVRRKLHRQATTAAKRVNDLIASAGAKDEEDLHRRAAIVAEARHLEEQRGQLHDDITTALSACESPAEVGGHLDAGADLRRLADETSAAKHALRGKLGQVWEERGAVAQQLKAMTAHRGLAEKRIELATVNQQLREAVQRWQVLSACSLALESVRAVYERDRQPEVLRRRRRTIWPRLTGGRYQRIWTTLGGRMLSVDDTDGHPIAVDVLSCGTREQIFLSLRLALVTAYARRGIRLPVVMDDVLVNFDTTRAQAAVSVLAEFARAGHQLLVFTCHEHLAWNCFTTPT